MARTKGAKGQRTIESEEFRDKMRMYCHRGGFERFFEELGKLKGAEYVRQYLAALEFSEPKLQRTEVVTDDKKMLIVLDLPLIRKNIYESTNNPATQGAIEAEEGEIVPIESGNKLIAEPNNGRNK